MRTTDSYESMLRRMHGRDRFIKRVASPVGIGLGIIVLFVAGLSFGVLLTMGIVALLWNVLLPMFWPAAPILSVWQVFGAAVILILLRMLVFGHVNVRSDS